MPALPSLQDIPSTWAKFCLRVEAFLKEAAPEAPALHGSGLVVALSGGVDSTSLLVILCLLARRNGYSLYAAHLHHGIRAESDREEDHVRDLCQDLDIPLSLERTDVPRLARESGMGLEEAGRAARQDFLERIRRQTGSRFILTGHQLNDLAEDVLMRMVRGTGWPALAGMRAWCPEQHTLRPLLLVPKQELCSLLQALGFTWVEDGSNEDQAFFRNRMRHQALPLFMQENPRLLEQFAGLWQLGELDREYWNGLLDRAFQDPGIVEHGQDRTILLRADWLRQQPRALRLRMYKHLLETLGSGQPLMTNLFNLDKAFTARATGRTIQFPGSKTALLTREGIRFSRPSPASSHRPSPHKNKD